MYIYIYTHIYKHIYMRVYTYEQYTHGTKIYTYVEKIHTQTYICKNALFQIHISIYPISSRSFLFFFFPPDTSSHTDTLHSATFFFDWRKLTGDPISVPTQTRTWTQTQTQIQILTQVQPQTQIQT